MSRNSDITAERVLIWLLEGMCELISSRRNLYRWHYNQMFPGYLENISPKLDKAIRRRVHRYKKQGWVIVSENKGIKWLSLSDKGRKRLLLEKIKNIKFNLLENWDGYWRVIIYDLGDMRARHRHLLRSTLLRWGFCHVQKSVFVYPYDCKREVHMLTEFYDLGNSVWIFEASKAENADALKKFFKMQ